MIKQKNNIIILGSGRSGTSMVAGLFRNSGYYMGDNYILPRESNPKGFFEDSEINNINEEILFNSYPKKYPFLGEWVYTNRDNNNRWLARVPLNVKLYSSESIIKKINKIIEKTPYCFKDPRFSYTLPIWEPYFKNTLFICVFRNPVITSRSIINEINNSDYLKKFNIDIEITLDLWTMMYKHILKNYNGSKNWLFIHYNQILTVEGLNKISNFTGLDIDITFPEKIYNRTKGEIQMDDESFIIYNKLCNLAGYKE